MEKLVLYGTSACIYVFTVIGVCIEGVEGHFWVINCVQKLLDIFLDLRRSSKRLHTFLKLVRLSVNQYSCTDVACTAVRWFPYVFIYVDNIIYLCFYKGEQWPKIRKACTRKQRNSELSRWIRSCSHHWENIWCAPSHTATLAGKTRVISSVGDIGISLFPFLVVFPAGVTWCTPYIFSAVNSWFNGAVQYCIVFECMSILLYELK